MVSKFFKTPRGQEEQGGFWLKTMGSRQGAQRPKGKGPVSFAFGSPGTPSLEEPLRDTLWTINLLRTESPTGDSAKKRGGHRSGLTCEGLGLFWWEFAGLLDLGDTRT